MGVLPAFVVCVCVAGGGGGGGGGARGQRGTRVLCLTGCARVLGGRRWPHAPQAQHLCECRRPRQSQLARWQLQRLPDMP
jgi:hypothetical protein